MLALPVALAFPLLWARSPTRLVAALVSASYFLAASRGLPEGVAAFYGTSLWPGLVLWAAASLAFVAVHSLLWSIRSRRGQAKRFFVASVLMAIPPFGIVGWAHPVTAAGVLFPGAAWWGGAATFAGLVAMTTRFWPTVALGFSGLWLWSAVTWTDPVSPGQWKGLDLEHGEALGRDTSLGPQRELIAKARKAANEGASYLLLPENALGHWTPTTAKLWQRELEGTGITVIAGATDMDGAGYDNVMVKVGATGSQILYRQRMPVPVSMWQPWRFRTDRGGARAAFFKNSVVVADRMRLAPLICYEQLLVWPMIQSMLGAPDVILASANGWWANQTSILAIQRASVMAWAKLFSKPVIMAFNR